MTLQGWSGGKLWEGEMTKRAIEMEEIDRYIYRAIETEIEINMKTGLDRETKRQITAL